MTRKKVQGDRKATRRKGNGVTVPVTPPKVEPVYVQRVTCDGATPGGYRIRLVPVQPGERV